MAPHAMKRQKVHHVPEPEHTLTRHHQVKPNGHASTPTTSNATTKTGDRLGPSVDSPDMLALQVEELLAKVRPNYGMRMSKVEDVLRKLRQIIDGIPHREAMNVRLDSTPVAFARSNVIRHQKQNASYKNL